MQRTLALLVRSLRQETVSARPHLTRAVFVVPILLFLCYVSSGRGISSAPGWYFFKPLVFLNFFFITVAGCSYFATAITEEKEEQTLGLLRMAGVGPLTLLLGKGTSRLVSFSLLLAVQFPFMFLAVTMGGVAVAQVTAVFAALLAYMLLLSSLGLLCSVFCRTSSRAASLATLLVLIFLFLPTIAGWTWAALLGAKMINPGSTLMGWVNQTLLWSTEISPFYRTMAILQSGFTASWLSLQVVTNTLGSALLFAIAWWTFDLFNREEHTVAPARSWIPRMSSTRTGNPMGTRRVWRNALMWKDFHFLAGGKTMVIAKLIGYSLLAILLTGWISYVESLHQIDHSLLGRVLIGGGLIAMMLESTFIAGRIFRQECQWQTLSGLTMLPISTARLAYSKLLGCCLGLIPAAIMVIAGSVVSPQIIWNAAKHTLIHPSEWCGWLAFAVFLHLIAYLSLRMKRGALPIAFLLMALCYLLLAGGVVVVFSAMLSNGPNPEVRWVFEHILPPVFALILLSVAVVLHIGVGRGLRRAASD